MMVTNYSVTRTRICNRTCSSTAMCDTCEENPNGYIVAEYINTYSNTPELPGPKGPKKLTNFEKVIQRKNWKAIQDKHSKRR